jgi:hypothetical protein
MSYVTEASGRPAAFRYEVACFHSDIADSSLCRTIDSCIHHRWIDVQYVNDAGDTALRCNCKRPISAAELDDVAWQIATFERLQKLVRLEKPLPHLAKWHLTFPTFSH